MRRTAVLKKDLFMQHDPGYGHPESPDRLKVIYDFLESSSIQSKLIFPEIHSASLEHIEKIHTLKTVEAAKRTSGKMYDVLDQDTTTSKESYNAALHAAGAMLTGIDMLMNNEADNCLALVRPPGHHAEKERSMGFCLFNNIAVGAQYALDEYGLDRVLIFDWDVHHGNGTQHSFYNSEQVLFISAHQYPFYPGSGRFEEVGKGEGMGYTINIPMPPGMGDMDYAMVINKIIEPIAEEFKPELILISCGFDTFIDDPLGSMEVTEKGYRYMTRRLVEIAEKHCDGKILITLEGGYSLTGQKEGTIAVLSELLGRDIESESQSVLDKDEYDLMKKNTSKHPVIVKATAVAKKYWKM